MIYLWTRENDSLIRDEKNLLRKEEERKEFISQSPSPMYIYIRTYIKKIENKEILRADHIDIDYLIL